ncbi:sugar ABC transporter permease [Marinitoga aeolica]|uniref:ABC transporter permease subunit n=1 Tax=Marinitoga aeolica TaxID=2809031 RepID=A0ABY8PS53_9BACT|nr:ABC transporter permease subunit [Marinitoga aeolica]WGS65461.1 ABC transporter permease subunit [Marinitoga aeolica]
MAMIQKKNYLLRHIFLIIIIVIVLFPLVWVVTTSIRRDNAAFSPKLFSSRITLNYYRDLLFPRATVPELIKDINGTAHFIGKNSQLSLEEASKKLNNELSDFTAYISQTNTYLDDIDSNFKNLLSSLETNKEDIINDINKSRISELKNLEEIEKSMLSDITTDKISEELDNLKNSINEYYKLRNEILLTLNNIPKTTKNEKYYQDTLSTIFSTSPKYTLWKIKTYKKWLKIENNENISNLNSSVKTLIDKWKNISLSAKKIDSYFENLEKQMLGKDLENINLYETEMKNIQKNISITKNNISKIESLVVKYNNDLSSLLEIYAPDSLKIESAVNIFKKYKNQQINNSNVLALSNDINYISNTFLEINKNMASLADFENYKNAIEIYTKSFAWLKNYLIYINPELEYVSPAYKTLIETIKNVKTTLDTLNSVALNLKTNLEKLENYQNTLNKLNSELEITQEKYNELYSKNKSVLENFEKLKKYGEFTIIKSIAQIPISNYYESEYFSDILSSKLFEFYKPSKKDLNIFTLKKNIEEANEKFLESKASFKKIISEINPNLEKLENNSSDYLKINYGGYTADIEPVMKISSVYNSQYGPAKANISRASRIVSDLADSVKYKTLKSDLRNIDKNIYDLLDNWNPKQRKPFLRWLLNSIIVAGLTSILTVMITSVAAYPFSRMRFIGRKEGLLYLMLIQMFPAIMYMVALYGMLKFMGDYFGFIGLDTLSGLIFVYLGGVSFNMWLIKGYYDTIPDSLEESAMIDGATRFQTFWLIVLPLASPILAVVTILSFMGTFNEFVLARIVLSSEQNFTYAVGLQTFTSGPFETEWGLFTAAALLGAVPMVLLFLSMQKYLVGGLTQGSVKG